jgi:hypothetical protein
MVNRPGVGLEVADEVHIVASLTQCRESAHMRSVYLSRIGFSKS